ncbi:MAG: hypothetical protein COB42_06790 [Sulfurimonas sp.]|nr:MAG: hypothetical protein COB42_06790 [Sulfurimonas sp.]
MSFLEVSKIKLSIKYFIIFKKRHEHLCKGVLFSDALSFELNNFNDWCSSLITKNNKDIFNSSKKIEEILTHSEEDTSYHKIRLYYKSAIIAFAEVHNICIIFDEAPF